MKNTLIYTLYYKRARVCLKPSPFITIGRNTKAVNYYSFEQVVICTFIKSGLYEVGSLPKLLA